MSEEYQRTNRKAPSMRSGAKSSDQGRSANKARSYRAETYNPDDPNRIEPETVYLNNVSYCLFSLFMKLLFSNNFKCLPNSRYKL